MYRNAVRGGPRMVTGNIHKNLVKFSRVVFELCKWTDTDKQPFTALLDFVRD